MDFVPLRIKKECSIWLLDISFVSVETVLPDANHALHKMILPHENFYEMIYYSQFSIYFYNYFISKRRFSLGILKSFSVLSNSDRHFSAHQKCSNVILIAKIKNLVSEWALIESIWFRYSEISTRENTRMEIISCVEIGKPRYQATNRRKSCRRF